MYLFNNSSRIKSFLKYGQSTSTIHVLWRKYKKNDEKNLLGSPYIVFGSYSPIMCSMKQQDTVKRYKYCITCHKKPSVCLANLYYIYLLKGNATIQTQTLDRTKAHFIFKLVAYITNIWNLEYHSVSCSRKWLIILPLSFKEHKKYDWTILLKIWRILKLWFSMV